MPQETITTFLQEGAIGETITSPSNGTVAARALRNEPTPQYLFRQPDCGEGR